MLAHGSGFGDICDVGWSFIFILDGLYWKPTKAKLRGGDRIVLRSKPGLWVWMVLNGLW